MARLLLLLPTNSYQVAEFMAAAHRLDVDVVVGSNRQQVLEYYADGTTLTVNFGDVREGCREILDFSRERPLRAVVGVDERTAILAAMVSSALGLSHNDPAACSIAADKYRQRQHLAASSLLCPKFRLLEGRKSWSEAAASASYPQVLKPLKLSASRGVIRVNNAVEFSAAAERILKILECDDAPLLMEDYIPGEELALEGLMTGGRLRTLALFDKPDPLVGPYFEETLYVTPSRLTNARQRSLSRTVEEAARVFGISEGPVHAELRFNEEGCWLIELAARTIGGRCGRSLRFAGDLSLEDLVLRHALGLPLRDVERQGEASGVMMIPIPKKGRLMEVKGEADARAQPGVTDLSIMIPLGDELVPLPEGDRYLGFIFAQAGEPAAVEAALRAAHNKLSFSIA